MSNQKIYFASDFHLGVPTYEKSRQRENLLVEWLTMAEQDATEIFLVGDLFDFWFEYKHTAPKGFIRFLGKLASICDKGIPVHVFTGNHDMWMYEYLEKEIGVKIYREPIRRTFNGKSFLIGHGDGLGPGDYKYKLMKNFFASSICQWLYARLHPNLAFALANFLSRRSRASTGNKDDIFKGEKDEWLLTYCKEVVAKENIDFFIFGHRHLPLQLKVSETSTYINLGEWLNYNSYAVFDTEGMKLLNYKASDKN